VSDLLAIFGLKWSQLLARNHSLRRVVFDSDKDRHFLQTMMMVMMMIMRMMMIFIMTVSYIGIT